MRDFFKDKSKVKEKKKHFSHSWTI